MNLKELKPRYRARVWKGNKPDEKYLIFKCPVCGPEGLHEIEIPIPPTPKAWQITGIDGWNNFEKISITPSIAHETEDADFMSDEEHIPRPCKSHFFITEGKIIML